MARYKPPRITLNELTIVPLPGDKIVGPYDEELAYKAVARDIESTEIIPQYAKLFTGEISVAYTFSIPSSGEGSKFKEDVEELSKLSSSTPVVPLWRYKFSVSGWGLVGVMSLQSITTEPFNNVLSNIKLTKDSKEPTEESPTGDTEEKETSASVKTGEELTAEVSKILSNSKLNFQPIFAGFALLPPTDVKDKSGYGTPRLFMLPAGIGGTEELSLAISAVASDPPMGLGTNEKSSQEVLTIISKFKSGTYEIPVKGSKESVKLSAPLVNGFLSSEGAGDVGAQVTKLVEAVRAGMLSNEAISKNVKKLPDPIPMDGSDTQVMNLAFWLSKYPLLAGQRTKPGKESSTTTGEKLSVGEYVVELLVKSEVRSRANAVEDWMRVSNSKKIPQFLTLLGCYLGDNSSLDVRKIKDFLKEIPTGTSTEIKLPAPSVFSHNSKLEKIKAILTGASSGSKCAKGKEGESIPFLNLLKFPNQMKTILDAIK